MLERILRNPVGWLVGLIVVLVLVQAYLGTIMQVGSVIAVIAIIVYVGRFFMKRAGRSSSSDNQYCARCSHPAHGRQTCGRCRCDHS